MTAIITPDELAELQDLDARVAKANLAQSRAEAKANKVKAERKRLYGRLASRVPFNKSGDTSDVTPVSESHAIRRLLVTNGERVDLKAYREEHRISPQLRKHIVTSTYEKWTVVELDDE